MEGTGGQGFVACYVLKCCYSVHFNHNFIVLSTCCNVSILPCIYAVLESLGEKNQNVHKDPYKS